jgi:hypothetical protein
MTVLEILVAFVLVWIVAGIAGYVAARRWGR